MGSYKEIRVGTAKDGTPIVQRVPNVSKENSQEYQHDKRIKELASRGYNSSNIRYMMGHDKFSEKRIKQGQKASGVERDGKL